MSFNIKSNNSALFITQSAVIAALYAALTYVSSAMGLAYGPIQFRLSEALCILPVFTPAAIPGLAVGCLLANIGSPYGIIDIVIGTSATLSAAVLTRVLRNITVKSFPLLSSLMPVIFNCLFVGAEIAYFLPKGTRISGFFISFLEVGAGEIICAVILGYFLYRALKKRNVFK